MSEKPYYITTPIYYPSGNPHIGHCYTTVACDSIARYRRMQGYDVMFLTGTDEHGLKIEQKAAEKGVTPKEYVDEVVKTFKSLWNFMNVDYDRYIRTTDDYHIKTVQKILKNFTIRDTFIRASIRVNTALLVRASGQKASLLTANVRIAAERLQRLRKRLISSKWHLLPTELKNYLRKQTIYSRKPVRQSL